MTDRSPDDDSAHVPVPDGEERLATGPERDDVNERIEDSHSTPASGPA